MSSRLHAYIGNVSIDQHTMYLHCILAKFQCPIMQPKSIIRGHPIYTVDNCISNVDSHIHDLLCLDLAIGLDILDVWV
jgi:hypothetical protein